MTTVSVKVAASGDDGRVSGTDFGSTDTSYAPAPSAGRGFFRFTGVAVPQGATVTSASITFYRATAKGTGNDIIVGAHDADDSSAPTTTADLTGRARTALTTTNFPTGAANSAFVAACTSAVQAVVSRTGWASGNALTLICTSAGDSGVPAVFWFDNGNAAYYPTLDVDYTTGGGGGPPTPAQPALIHGSARVRAANF